MFESSHQHCIAWYNVYIIYSGQNSNIAYQYILRFYLCHTCRRLLTTRHQMTFENIVKKKKLLIMSMFFLCHIVYNYTFIFRDFSYLAEMFQRHLMQMCCMWEWKVSYALQNNNLHISIRLDCNTLLRRSTRKPTLWTLRNVSTWISLRIPLRLIRADTFRHRDIQV